MPSSTKEEIDTFWKLQGKFNDEDQETFSPSSFSKDSPREGGKKSNLFRSNSAPSPPEFPVKIKIGDWWMTSKWASLNEPTRGNMDDPDALAFFPLREIGSSRGLCILWLQ